MGRKSKAELIPVAPQPPSPVLLRALEALGPAGAAPVARLRARIENGSLMERMTAKERANLAMELLEGVKGDSLDEDPKG